MAWVMRFEGGDSVDAFGDGALAAVFRVACSASEQGVGYGAVGIVDDGYLLVGAVGDLDVGGEDGAIGTEVDVGSADVFVEGASLGEDDGGYVDVPGGGGLGDEGIGGGVVDVGAEVAGVGEVEGVGGEPDDGFALNVREIG